MNLKPLQPANSNQLLSLVSLYWLGQDLQNTSISFLGYFARENLARHFLSLKSERIRGIINRKKKEGKKDHKYYSEKTGLRIADEQKAEERDLDRLEKWADRNLMKFSKGKCKVLDLGRNNPIHQHMLGTIQMESSSTEKDLEVLTNTKLNMIQQHALVAKKANGILCCIQQNIANRWRDVILPVYSVLVRPYPDCCVQFWTSQYRRDLDVFEIVQ
ncbi:hypothetical protein WISP_119109 [Willisornis vidua]|uniref:Rna-directed dna polymerase from mobile element jockey-like n=1 Tax=Willisornis vidua TaxID=1566151 RepID=A0ABQ9CY18_9PASS|nr:hypothetical protein WISP_119109 [Willisornis vidua]